MLLHGLVLSSPILITASLSLSLSLSQMGHHNHQPASKDSHGIVSSIRDIWKAYRSLVSKWNLDNNQSNKEAGDINARNDNKKAERRVVGNESNNTTETRRVGSDPVDLQKGKNPDDRFFKRSCSFLSRSTSRRSQTPPPSKPGMVKSASVSAGRSSSTPTQILRSKSTRNVREAGSGHREGNRTDLSHTNRVSRNGTRAGGPTPIVFSHSTELKKPPPTEKGLECTLEELCHGSIKKIKITRNVMSKTGQLNTEEETLRIKVKPGWKKGTQITFEGKGDERPGTHPADIIFTIHEEKHSLFTRIGDDLEVVLEVPLLKALTGCSLSVPLLGGENMHLSIDSIIHPGFEKIIHGQGMPKSSEEGKRGDLHVKFFVTFPTDLSANQRKEAYSILKDCC